MKETCHVELEVDFELCDGILGHLPVCGLKGHPRTAGVPSGVEQHWSLEGYGLDTTLGPADKQTRLSKHWPQSEAFKAHFTSLQFVYLPSPIPSLSPELGDPGSVWPGAGRRAAWEWHQRWTSQSLPAFHSAAHLCFSPPATWRLRPTATVELRGVRRTGGGSRFLFGGEKKTHKICITEDKYLHE